MLKQLHHIANPMQTTEIEVAAINRNGLVTESGYIRTTNPDSSRFGIKWVNIGSAVNPAHNHEITALSPADLEAL